MCCWGNQWIAHSQPLQPAALQDTFCCRLLKCKWSMRFDSSSIINLPRTPQGPAQPKAWSFTTCPRKTQASLSQQNWRTRVGLTFPRACQVAMTRMTNQKHGNLSDYRGRQTNKTICQYLRLQLVAPKSVSGPLFWSAYIPNIECKGQMTADSASRRSGSKKPCPLM